MPHVFEISHNTLKRLRRLRLWHWKQCLRFRHIELSLLPFKRDQVAQTEAKAFGELANFHIRMVQVLNDFFPEVGDTAEHDAQLESEQL
jgi:hypothetical protein